MHIICITYDVITLSLSIYIYIYTDRDILFIDIDCRDTHSIFRCSLLLPEVESFPSARALVRYAAQFSPEEAPDVNSRANRVV